MTEEPKKPAEAQKKPKLRKLDKNFFICFFPFLFAVLFVYFAAYWEYYYHEPFSVWAYLLLIPLALLGMAMGYQLEFWLQKHIGKKAEALVAFVLTVILLCGLYAEYQYVLVPKYGLPPLTWARIRDVLLKHLHLKT